MSGFQIEQAATSTVIPLATAWRISYPSAFFVERLSII
jgi:hypothetical protein